MADFPSPDELKSLDGRVGILERAVALLQADMAEIKAILPFLATRTDVAVMSKDVTSKIDTAINGLLKSALDSVPMKATVWVGVLTALVMIFGTVVTLLQFFK